MFSCSIQNFIDVFIMGWVFGVFTIPCIMKALDMDGKSIDRRNKQ